MKKGLMKDVAKEIRHSLVHDTVPRRKLQSTVKAGMGDALLQQLASEVLRQLEDEETDAEVGELEARITSLEALVHQFVASDVDHGDDDEDEVKGGESQLPNLKYAKPKYKDVESVLKYVEDGDSGGLKLVIMNFND